MSEFVLTRGKFGRIAIEVDPALSGVTAAGQLTDGAVLSVLIGDQVRADVRAASRPSEFARKTDQHFAAWLAGDAENLDLIGVQLRGTEFQQRVLKAMRKIKPGKTASYAELAQKAGRPTSVRAAASVCARNRVPLIIPCHRVVRSDGSLGNYYYGTAMKQDLLVHEGCQF